MDLVQKSELVVINDGSTDKTGDLIAGMTRDDPRIRIVNKTNGGHGSAVLRGLSDARGRFVFLVDSDMQIPMSAFADLWKHIKDGRDGAFGVRRERNDPRTRLWLTFVVRRVLPIILGVRMYDANVPFKILRRSIYVESSVNIPEDTLAPSLFLAVFARLKGYNLAEIDVAHRERMTGQASIIRWKLVKFCIIALGQLLRFRRGLRKWEANQE